MKTEALSSVPVAGGQIAYRRIGSGRPVLVLNGFAATNADWDPSFIDGVASCNELILLDNRGIGGSADNGQPFDIGQLADDAAHVIGTLGFEQTSVMGWSMGGFIAQALALQHPHHVDKLILLSTDSGGPDTDRASPAVWSQLIDTSGTPHEQARRLLFLLFPGDVAESLYRQFGDIVAAARAQLSPELVKRQAAAIDAWHNSGVASRLRQSTRSGVNRHRRRGHCHSSLKCVKTRQRNSRRVACPIPSCWSRLYGAIPTGLVRSHQLFPRI